MATTFKLFSDKMGGRAASAYIGTAGEMFYDSTTGGLRVSDGTTVGGKPIEIAGASLTGNVDANVNLRSGTLSSLLALAGGTSEIGYATDSPSLVRFNGVAGGAQVIAAASTDVIKNYTYNFANKNTVIDCNGVNYLILNVDDLGFADQAISTNIRIKFPDSRTTPKFTIIKTGIGEIGINSERMGQLRITPTYQTGDPRSYEPIPADYVVDSITSTPLFTVSTRDAFQVEFLTTIYGWTRNPLPWEIKSTTNNGYLPGTVGGYAGEIYQSGTTALTSGNSIQLGNNMDLKYGRYLIYWIVEYTSTNATALNVSEVMASISTSAPAYPDRAMMQITNLPNTKTVTLSGTTFGFDGIWILSTTATITSGSVSARGHAYAVRLN
jgi:hypothetical protein